MAFDPVPFASIAKLKQGRYLAPAQMSAIPNAAKDVPVVGGNGVLGYTDKSSYRLGVPLITCRGSRCGLLQWVDAPVWVSNNAIACDTGSLEGNLVLRYVISATSFADVITGSAQPQITVGHLATKQLNMPPRSLWHELVEVLSPLDDRIELLSQANATLEAIAQALFKSWFVGFDPVCAKAEGREPEGMDAATAALFPSEFEDSELGLIPKGWSVGALADLIELKYGKALKASDRKPGSIPVFGSGGFTGTHESPLVSEPTIVVGRKGTVGALYWQSEPCYPIDTVFFVVPKKSLHFSYHAMRLMGLDQLNTDAAVPGLNRDNAYRQPVVLPSDELLRAWDGISSAVRRRIDESNRQILTLQAVRDTLLPRLISGKLRLPEAEAQIEALV